MEVKDLFTEELLLALPRDHPLTRKRTVNLPDLENERFIVMKEGHCLGDQLLNFCERRALKPNMSFRSAQLETIQALVSSGIGISLIPAMAASRHREDLPEYRSLPRAAALAEDRSALARTTPPRPRRKGVSQNSFLRSART